MTNNVMKYKLIVAYNKTSFEEEVNKALQTGWVLLGATTIIETPAHYNGTTYCKDSITYGQALTCSEAQSLSNILKSTSSNKSSEHECASKDCAAVERH